MSKIVGSEPLELSKESEESESSKALVTESPFAIRMIRRFEHYSDRWWYLPTLGILAFLDLFVVVIPSEGLLVSSVMLRPRRWLIASATMTMGSALGSVALAVLIRWFGEPLIDSLMPGAFNSDSWRHTANFIGQYGALAMALIALSPFPQQPAVTICALAHMPLPILFFAVIMGRAPKYFLFGYTATHAPKYFSKFWKKLKPDRYQ